MKCSECNKEFIVKRKISDLLKKQFYLICDDCYKKYPIKIEYIELPLNNNHYLKIISLLDESIKINKNAYLIEYSKIVEKYLKEYPILIDNLVINKRNMTQFEYLSKIIKNDVLIITFTCRIV